MQGFPLCQALALEPLSLLHRTYFFIGAGTHLYPQGVALTETYLLCRGWLMLYRVLREGQRQVLRLVLPGDLLGFRLGGPERSGHSALTLSDSTYCVLPPLFEILRVQPSFAFHMATSYGRQISLKNDYLSCIAQRKAKERIAFLMVELYRRLQLLGLNRGNTLFFPLTQEDIADTLGLTAVHVNRILRILRDRNVVNIRRRQLEILDFDTLCEWAGVEKTGLEPLNKAELFPLHRENLNS